jgi:hypothetical protein
MPELAEWPKERHRRLATVETFNARKGGPAEVPSTGTHAEKVLRSIQHKLDQLLEHGQHIGSLQEQLEDETLPPIRKKLTGRIDYRNTKIRHLKVAILGKVEDYACYAAEEV